MLSYIRQGQKYIVAMLIAMALAYVAVLYTVSPVGGDKTPVVVVVRKGDSAEKIGRKLTEHGLIHSSMGFALVARVSGDAGSIKPGAYQISKDMSVPVILNKLVEGDVAAIWITIPEGFTLSQIADRLSAKRLIDRDAFIATAKSEAMSFGDIVDIPASSTEGYLFPDTYLIKLDSTPGQITRQMLMAFKKNVIGEHTGSGNTESAAVSLYRTVTVASLIEREARVPQDRALISAVIWNRLKKGMRLQVDATVIYALGGHRERLLYSDLEVDSPYNTYRHTGLPPGPIANPGLESIKAALNPARVDYLYYVAKPDGSHVFTRTLAEHQNAIRSIRSND